MKNKLLSGGAAIAMFLAIGVQAQAADVIVEDPITDWSGFYLGAHVGYGWANFDGCFDCDSDTSILRAEELDLEDIIYGVHGGYNWQMDSFVLGIEADVSFTEMDDSEPSPDSSDAQSAEVDLLASVRARLGIALDEMLLYATAGVAIPDAKWEGTNLDSGASRSADFGEIGGVAGGGVEFAMTDSIRLRAEGLYYFFGEEEDVEVSGGPSGEIEFEDVIVVRGGVSFYF